MALPKSLLFLALLSSPLAVAGPYAPAAGQPDSTALAAADPSISAWATGYLDYLPGANVSDTFKTPQKALGAASGNPTDTGEESRGWNEDKARIVKAAAPRRTRARASRSRADRQNARRKKVRRN